MADLGTENADIIATVTLYKERKGARFGPTPNELRCKMVINDQVLDVRLYFERTGPLLPGETKENVPIRFLYLEHARPLVAPGKRFFLRELGDIGEGKITRVLH